MNKFAKSFLDIIDNRIKILLKSAIYAEVYGFVKSADNRQGTAVVLVNSSDISVPNRSGELLVTGDTVLIAYKANISLGCITRKLGKYRPSGIDLTQSEFDQLETDGKLIEGQTYYITGD